MLLSIEAKLVEIFMMAAREQLRPEPLFPTLAAFFSSGNNAYNKMHP